MEGSGASTHGPFNVTSSMVLDNIPTFGFHSCHSSQEKVGTDTQTHIFQIHKCWCYVYMKIHVYSTLAKLALDVKEEEKENADQIYQYKYVNTCTLFSHTVPPAAPSGVMVDGVDDTSVRVSWGTVDDADRYTVTFTTPQGTSQQGLCIFNIHKATVSVDAPSTSASIGVGQMLELLDITMLRAYTTYSITVVAESDVTGSSEDSEPVTVTTAQTSKW